MSVLLRSGDPDVHSRPQFRRANLKSLPKFMAQVSMSLIPNRSQRLCARLVLGANWRLIRRPVFLWGLLLAALSRMNRKFKRRYRSASRRKGVATALMNAASERAISSVPKPPPRVGEDNRAAALTKTEFRRPAASELLQACNHRRVAAILMTDI